VRHVASAAWHWDRVLASQQPTTEGTALQACHVAQSHCLGAQSRKDSSKPVSRLRAPGIVYQRQPHEMASRMPYLGGGGLGGCGGGGLGGLGGGNDGG
jgi:hypothetical protein